MDGRLGAQRASSPTAGEVREELLRLAPEPMPDSPLADAELEDVVLADGRHRRASATRAASVSIADAMRRGGVERIEKEEHRTSSAKDDKHMRATRIRRSSSRSRSTSELGVIRVTRVVSAVAAGRILNAEDRAQPDPRRRRRGASAWRCTRRR